MECWSNGFSECTDPFSNKTHHEGQKQTFLHPLRQMIAVFCFFHLRGAINRAPTS
jgi:hypothetical protein